MGYPVSVVLAELILQHLEKTMFDDSPTKTNLWKGYLNNFVAIVPRVETSNFWTTVSLNVSIQFTIENNNYNSLHFRFIGSELILETIKKFHINHRKSHEKAVVKSLIDRTNNLCS